MCTTLSHERASTSLCVAIRIVCPFFLELFFKSTATFTAVLESRFPGDSSARTMVGVLASVRATAALLTVRAGTSSVFPKAPGHAGGVIHIQDRDQAVVLENKPNAPAPEDRPFLLAKPGNVHAAYGN